MLNFSSWLVVDGCLLFFRFNNSRTHWLLVEYNSIITQLFVLVDAWISWDFYYDDFLGDSSLISLWLMWEKKHGKTNHPWLGMVSTWHLYKCWWLGDASWHCFTMFHLISWDLSSRGKFGLWVRKECGLSGGELPCLTRFFGIIHYGSLWHERMVSPFVNYHHFFLNAWDKPSFFTVSSRLVGGNKLPLVISPRTNIDPFKEQGLDTNTTSDGFL